MKTALAFLSILLFGITISCNNKPVENQPRETKVKNIILLIADGMGISEVYAAMSTSESELNMEKMDYSAFVKTFSLTDYITDSAAGGTAIATGYKTKNGVIAQDTLGNEYTSILELAERHGLATGLVSTSAITHATPASFIAHESSRHDYEAIAADFLSTDIDVFIGGGRIHFENRKDGLNLIDSLAARGYHVTSTMEEVNAVSSGKLAGFTADVHNPPYAEGREDMLPEATLKALELIGNDEDGFFLMVEGSQIDWAGHDNDIDYLLHEMMDFDRAVGVALEFARENGETLVIVTSDHETGGLTLTDGDLSENEIEPAFSTGGHTAVMVPLFAAGPGAELFRGIMDNTDIFHLCLKLYRFEDESLVGE